MLPGKIILIDKDCEPDEITFDLYRSEYPESSTKSYIPLDENINSLIKRSFDLVFSTILILFVFPLLLPFIAILIKLSSRGPVFFLQKRIKKDGKSFTCIKFRTMVVNKEADHLPSFENDKRITSTGKFLRIHHLDELPQLFNVWSGDMSLIGPRPYMITENENYSELIDNYNYRHKVRPGITGLAQSFGHFGYVHDKYRLQKRVEMDHMYVREWSLKMDILIIFRTLSRSFKLKK